MRAKIERTAEDAEEVVAVVPPVVVADPVVATPVVAPVVVVVVVVVVVETGREDGKRTLLIPWMTPLLKTMFGRTT